MAVKFPVSLVIQAIDKATGPLRAWNARMRGLFQPIRNALTPIGNRLTALAKEAGLPQLVDGFKGVGSALGNVGQEVLALGKRLLTMGAVAGAVFFGLTRSALDAGDELGEMAQRVGLTADAYAQLQFSAAQADVEQEAFNGAMDQFNKRLGEARAGGGPLLAFLKKVSPALALQVRGAKSTEAALGLAFKAFERIQDPARRAALSAAFFGKSGLQMGQWAGQGTAAIDAQRDRFLELAGSQERFVAGAGDLDNAMRETQVAFLGLRNVAAAELFPALTALARAVTSVVAGNREGLAAWARRVGEAFSSWVKGGGVQRLVRGLQGMLDVGVRIFDALGGWPVALGAVAAVMAGPLLGAIGGLISAVVTLGAAIGFTPVGWILAGLAAIAAIAVMVWRNFDSIKAVVGPAFAPVRQSVAELWLQLRRLWEVLGPLLMPALKTVGKILGALAVGGLLALANLLKTVVDFTAKWVGLLSDVVAWAKEAGATLGRAFDEAWAKVKPVAEALEKLRNPAGLLAEGVRAGVNFFSPDRPTLGAAGAAPVAAGAGGGGETRVTVDFTNLPRGVRVAEAPGGTAALDLAMGYSMVAP